MRTFELKSHLAIHGSVQGINWQYRTIDIPAIHTANM